MIRGLEYREKVINYYDLTQPFYKFFWHGESLGLHYGFRPEGVSNRKEAILRENEVLADLVGVNEGDVVLDAGCGVGGSGIWLANKRGAKVVGLNLVTKQLTMGRNLAKKRGLLSNLEFVEGDYHRLPFKNESFDVFWSLESIEHATDVDSFIKEAHRILINGGKIVIAATFRGREELSEEEERQILVGMKVSGAFTDFRTAGAVSEIMKQAGFVEVKNVDRTDWVMKSAQEMTAMCRWGLPAAKIGAALRLTPPVLIQNNQWGLYQEGLFRSGATSYNILLARKP